MRGILQKDLSAALPQIRVPRDAKIPSVWEQELIVRLLEAVDRSSTKGKRDYVILLLACRLGLRAGDIRTLKLDQLHWEDSTIEITQSKTGTALRLPLTGEVGDALIDYLKSGRPQTTHREIFLKVNPPFDPLRETICTTSSRIGACWQGSNFGHRKSVVRIRYATMPRPGLCRVLVREPRFMRI
jgi:integrase